MVIAQENPLPNYHCRVLRHVFPLVAILRTLAFTVSKVYLQYDKLCFRENPVNDLGFCFARLYFVLRLSVETILPKAGLGITKISS